MRLSVFFATALPAAALLVGGCGGNGAIPGAQAPMTASVALPAATSAIKNGCFSGLTGWTQVKGASPDTSNKASGSVKSVKGGYKSCHGSVFAGTSKEPAPNGYWGVTQSVTVTSAGKLSWWYWGGSNDQKQYGNQEVGVVTGKSITGKSSIKTCYLNLTSNPKTAWKLGTCNLKKYAHKKVTLFFGVYDNGYSKTYDYWNVSDISLQ